jgi:hypothetical protein
LLKVALKQKKQTKITRQIWQVMEIGFTDVGSGGYILVSCAHSNTSFDQVSWHLPKAGVSTVSLSYLSGKTYFHNQNITDCSDQKWKGPSSLHR